MSNTSATDSSATDASNAETALRRRLFRGLVLGFLLLTLSAQLLQWLFTYDATSLLSLRYGSYGLYLAKVRPPSDKTRVVLLGNSVYLGVEPAFFFDRFAREQGRTPEFVNLAQTGSAVTDHLLQAAYALESNPDYVVLCHGSFSYYDLGREFNTDCDQMALDPTMLSRVPVSFLRRTFSLDSAVTSGISFLLPVRRLDPIIRSRLARRFVPRNVARALSLPTLNLVRDDERLRRRSGSAALGWIERPLRPDYRETLDELVTMVERAGVPLLLIRQQCGPTAHSAEVEQALRECAARHPRTMVVDLEKRWDAAYYTDSIHPKRSFHRRYAHSHYKAITRLIDAFPPARTARR